METDRITLRELRKQLLDPQIPESDLRPYFKVDAARSQAFAPAIGLDARRVDDEGLEGDIALRFLNGASRLRRKLRYRARLAEPGPHVRVVSEGDSWFQYPFLLDDVIDHLHERHERLAIRSLGAAGDLLHDIIAEDELTRAIEEERAELFLISGGGNDMVGGGRLAEMLHRFEAGREPDQYPNTAFLEFLGEIRDQYRGLFQRLTARFPNLRILCHGYDYALPRNGKWLGKPMRSLDITDAKLQADIVRVLIDHFNRVLRELEHEFGGNVHHVDCTGVVGGPDRWHDELHPTHEGYADVAGEFSKIIDRVLEHPRTSEPRCPGRAAFARDARELSERERCRITTHRARRILGEDVEPAADAAAAEALAKRIEFVQEKIHLGADFLPARFLADGFARAQAVCRIVTPLGLGSGFLVAGRGFIMTNNHVLEDADTAARSVAEFELHGDPAPTTVQLRPERLFITDVDLDFTIVACDATGLGAVTPVPLLRNPMTVDRGERVNIIQHPRGRTKEIAIHENRTVQVLDRFVRYTTDTEPGSSGSGVFNNDWELVALHHAGQPGPAGRAINEGIRMAAIVGHLVRRSRRESVARELSELVPDTSPYLGFFDVDGVGEGLEVELPDFRGTPDFADLGFWNVENFNDGIDGGRVEAVADVLARMSLDAIGLTEVSESSLKRLVGALRTRGLSARFVLEDTPGSQDLAVLFDRDTTEVQRDGDLSNRYREALSARTSGGRSAFPRHPLFARCRVEDEDSAPLDFLMIVVHLKAFGDATSRARRRLAARILGGIVEDIREREPELPVVLGGDFNERVNNDVLSGVTASPDLVTLTSDDQDANAASFIGGSRRSLIDHIIVSRDVQPGDIAGDDAAIIRLDRSVSDFAARVSDHVPIVMRVVLRDEPVHVGDAPRDGDDDRTTLAIPSGAKEVTLDFD